jgi:hypothetical protein
MKGEGVEGEKDDGAIDKGGGAEPGQFVCRTHERAAKGLFVHVALLRMQVVRGRHACVARATMGNAAS